MTAGGMTAGGMTAGGMAGGGSLILDFGGVVTRHLLEPDKQAKAAVALAVDPNTVLFDVRDPAGSFERALARLGLKEPHHA